MKKKIKDLTLEEALKICKKHSRCENCPLEILYQCPGVHDKNVLNDEVEINE